MKAPLFHPAVAGWFDSQFAAPTEPQAQAWPSIVARRHTLVAAPTGSGKTLAAFLAAIDALVRQGQDGALPDETQVVYVSPLKALSNDIHRNLQVPLEGIRRELQARGRRDVEIRTLVRTGDTPAAEREAMVRRPPHIVVTTPESLYILLTSRRGRDLLKTTRTVIVDEIHAVVGSKRGSHLALTLERLEALVGGDLVRIGLSATQRPIEDVARFLVGNRGGDPARQCTLVDSGHVRRLDLAIEIPNTPLEAVLSGEVWEEIYDRVAGLVAEHRTTLVFVNTRRMAERVARHLSERLGEEHVTSHHGSMAREHRLQAEQRLKGGRLRALVATASLELGIDIGDVDLVVQIGSMRSIAGFLQRVGRSGHAVGALPRGRIFPLSRDELVECAALLDAVRRGELDRLVMPQQPLDILAQQLVAMSASEDWSEDELYALVRRAWPYRELGRADFDAVVAMLSEGFSTARGRRSAWLHRDAVHRRVRGRRGARLVAITSGGAIPDNADYQVIQEPAGTMVGTVNEDFAFESLAGDVFQLGNTSWRILRIEEGRVRVEDAQGQAPGMPFWLGEAPARTRELSHAVSRLREEIAARLDAHPGRRDGNGHEPEAAAGPVRHDAARRWLVDEVGVEAAAAEQIVDYLAAAHAALGAMPTETTIVLERFFDESGGMQLVVHAPLGSRINRAWGLALRKRFCRKFNFELQAAATEDAIVLSLGPTHSFPLEEVFDYLKPGGARDVLEQALLDAPMWAVRWRWNVTRALAVLRFRGGRKVPAALQRMNSDDLLTLVFPDQVACFENLPGGRRDIPDHPLVKQTVRDCLEEAMDLDGLERLLADLERGAIERLARDVTEPSPLAQEILNAKPYAYLDDAPIEERRTRAVLSRRWLDPETAGDLGALDAEAIQRVRDEAWPAVESPDELHEALMLLGFATEAEGRGLAPEAEAWFGELAAARRATVLSIPGGGPRYWVTAERLLQVLAVHPQATFAPRIAAPGAAAAPEWSRDTALVELLRARLEGLGPVTAGELAASAQVPAAWVETALARLEAEGFALRGRFRPGAGDFEWCERRLLARIHRYTLKRLRSEIEPVQGADFVRFLLDWQRVAPASRQEGPQSVAAVVEQLEGFEAAAVAWEHEILPARVADYDPAWLDALCLSGRVVWTRRTLPRPAPRDDEAGPGRAGPVRRTPIALLGRKHAAGWKRVAGGGGSEAPRLSAPAQAVDDFLTRHGAAFFDEIVDGARLLRTQVEAALGELVAWGVVNSDSFTGLRALLVPSNERRPARGGRGPRRRTVAFGIEDAGRWTRLQPAPAADAAGPDDAALVETLARVLLRRWGVVFRRLLEREASLPPWRDLLRVYRRLEARGEIRGGRFVAGFAGEQYALPEAVAQLREVRRTPPSGVLVSVCGADPLNLVGLVTPGTRLPSTTRNRLLYRDGVPLAVREAGEVRFLIDLDPPDEWEARQALVRRPVPRASRRFSPPARSSTR